MKIESCTHTYETVCSDPKFCCDMMKDCVEQRIMSLDIGRVLLYHKDWDYNAQHPPTLRLMPIYYCPFCGEKIE